MITQAEFEKGLDFESKRIAKWINRTESPLDAMQSLIFDLICELDSSYYGIVGMLEETKNRYREICQEVQQESDSEESESNETFN